MNLSLQTIFWIKPSLGRIYKREVEPEILEQGTNTAVSCNFKMRLD